MLQYQSRFAIVCAMFLAWASIMALATPHGFDFVVLMLTVASMVGVVVPRIHDLVTSANHLSAGPLRTFLLKGRNDVWLANSGADADVAGLMGAGLALVSLVLVFTTSI